MEIDIILTNVSVPDEPFTGCGAVVSGKIGARSEWIFDVHNTGCVSFLYMIELARSLMASHGGRTALICSAQTAAGRIFSLPGVRTKPQAAIPGDGCGVGLFGAGIPITLDEAVRGRRPSVRGQAALHQRAADALAVLRAPTVDLDRVCWSRMPSLWSVGSIPPSSATVSGLISHAADMLRSAGRRRSQEDQGGGQLGGFKTPRHLAVPRQT